MLQLQDTVFAKADGKVLSAEYTKTYFTHISTDKTKRITKQFDGKDNGFAVTPDGPSTATVETLFNEMLDYIKAQYPSQAPELTIIEFTEKGLDLAKRANVGAALRPKEVNVDKVIERNAKGLVALGIYKSYDEAVTALKSQMAANAVA